MRRQGSLRQIDVIGSEKAGHLVNEPDPFRIVECHYPYRADEPVVLVSAAAQSVLGGDLGSSLVPDLARRVRDLVPPGPSPHDADLAEIYADDPEMLAALPR